MVWVVAPLGTQGSAALALLALLAPSVPRTSVAAKAVLPIRVRECMLSRFVVVSVDNVACWTSC